MNDLKKIVFITVLAFSTFTFGQLDKSKYKVLKNVIHRALDRESYVFSNMANVYEIPSADSKLISKLTRGSKVFGVELIDLKSEKNGITDYWLKVRYEKNDKVGFMWAGDLSISALDLDKQTKIIVGITGRKEYEKSKAEIKILKNNKVIAKHEFKAIDTPALSKGQYSYDVTSNLLSNKGFSPEVKLIETKFSYKACDFENGEIFFVWDGASVYEGLRHSKTNSVDYVISTDYSYIWPSDNNGLKNHLIVKRVETDKESKKETVSEMKYLWDGTKFVFQKK